MHPCRSWPPVLCQTKKSGVKNVWKFVPLRGGGIGRLMANTILNFHFDYRHPSLIVGICWVINQISIWNYDWRLWEFSGTWKFPGSWTFSIPWNFPGPGNFQNPWKILGFWIFPGPLENSLWVLISAQTGYDVLIPVACVIAIVHVDNYK